MSREAFPSLIVRANKIEPQGVFAEALARYLRPDARACAELARLLAARQAGVVAHFYMDPELQGTLAACSSAHVHISDSLEMADRAVQMAGAGARAIVVLGVDFMSENVRAVLDAAGFDRVPVYRVTREPIGCSLAEAAEGPAYGAYLARAAETPRSLHVIYINTSLRTKANAQRLLPTMTCTSSNVVRTVLQARAQIPELSVWYGPDTYMGGNLRQLFAGLARLDDDGAVRELHREHERASIADLLGRFHYFPQGVCIVHHLFGAEIARTVERDYEDALVTAHLEVPGEMFALALAAQRQGRGVVGSTANILRFVGEAVQAAARAGRGGRLRFVLGTEAAMVTPIMRRVQALLREHDGAAAGGLEAEIIFPVADEAVARTEDAELAVVPGVASGEGCSTAGGCATCPYMKMSSLGALLDLLARIGVEPDESLVAFHPRKYADTIGGRTVADLGGEPILHMREFQRTGRLPDALVADVLGRGGPT